jgi:predicted TIM-barrel fold metal-dependent hydrolase
MTDGESALQVPPGSCDCHMHVFGPPERYRGAPDRSYDPRERTLAEYEDLVRALGFERVVLVQPSAYGTDNSCLLDALRLRPQTARAVVVIGEEHDASALRTMHEAGVRGARLNLMTPRATDGSAARIRLEETARRIEPFGWHLQIYANLDLVRAVAPALKDLGLPVVFDHMGGATQDGGRNAPGFDALLSELADGRCWVKLSGADIVTWQNSDFSEATPFATALIAANERQVVWGSDWPHLAHQSAGTGADAPPAAYRPVNERALLRFLREWAGDDRTWRRILVENPQRLYQF